MPNFSNFAASFRLLRILFPEHPHPGNVYGDFISNGWEPKRPKINGLENIYDAHTQTHVSIEGIFHHPQTGVKFVENGKS